MNRIGYLVIAAVVVLVALLSSVFVVDERERALVLQFGQVARVEQEPGLKFKIPFIQEVVRYDDRILSLDTPAIEVTPSDDRRLIVDAFARYRVDDVVQLREATAAGGLRVAEDRLESILNARIREVLGADGVTSNTILSPDRALLMDRIRDLARGQASVLGVSIVDVRLKQTALPTQNLDATFARMRAEREREAADEIARGEEAAQRVRALADRTVVETVSDARRESEIARGEADAERNRVFAEAFGQDPDFFQFYRSLAAYRDSLNAGDTTLVLSPDSEFFDFLRDDGLDERDAAPRPARAGGPSADGDGNASEDEAAEPGTSGDAGADEAPDAGEASRASQSDAASGEGSEAPASDGPVDGSAATGDDAASGTGTPAADAEANAAEDGAATDPAEAPPAN